MTQFESSIKHIPYAQELVYTKLSDLRNLERIKDKLPKDKIQDFSCDEDSVTLSVSPIGELILAIIDREAPKCLKFETRKSPVGMNLWIQILPVTPSQCKLKLTVRAELNMIMKGVVSKPLKEGLEKMADMLAMIPYDK